MNFRDNINVEHDSDEDALNHDSFYSSHHDGLEVVVFKDMRALSWNE